MYKPEPPDDFDAILSHWYPIQAINPGDAGHAGFQEITLFVLPHA
jgi:hypothetical protein